MKSVAVLLALLSLSLSAFANGSAKSSAIVHNSNPDKVDETQVLRFLLGKDFKWSDGKPVIVVYHNEASATEYIKSLTGMTIEEFESHWKQLRTEGAHPLKSFSNQGALVAFVGLNPGALGIISDPEANDMVKVAH